MFWLENYREFFFIYIVNLRLLFQFRKMRWGKRIYLLFLEGFLKLFMENEKDLLEKKNIINLFEFS